MCSGSGKGKSAASLEQAKVYRLQRGTDIIQCALRCLLCLGVAAAAVTYLPREEIEWYESLAFAALPLALAVYWLSLYMPLRPSVEISDIGITTRAWFQAERFIAWSDIAGVIWIDRRTKRGHLYSLSVQVPEFVYPRSELKLAFSSSSARMVELRDEITKRCGLKHVPQPLSVGRSVGRLLSGTKRQVWR